MGLKYKKVDYDENETNLLPVRHFAIRSPRRVSQTNETVACSCSTYRSSEPLNAKKFPQWPQYEIFSQVASAMSRYRIKSSQNLKWHLITSLASVITSSVRMQPTGPTPLNILRQMVLRSCHRLLPRESRSQHGSIVHPHAYSGTRASPLRPSVSLS